MNRQETLWAGDFGTDYHMRNQQIDRSAFWKAVLYEIEGRFESVLELGAGQGDNLIAMKAIRNNLQLVGVDINKLACEVLALRCGVAIHGSAHDVELPHADLVITRGFLIHVQPNYLPGTYKAIHDASNRYIAIAEYFSPEPREIPYRGKGAALWARDFAGDMLSQFSDLKLLDYGFVYKGAGHDESLNWFLLEKQS